MSYEEVSIMLDAKRTAVLRNAITRSIEAFKDSPAMKAPYEAILEKIPEKEGNLYLFGGQIGCASFALGRYADDENFLTAADIVTDIERLRKEHVETPYE